jgi:hypothetical protein
VRGDCPTFSARQMSSSSIFRALGARLGGRRVSRIAWTDFSRRHVG